MSVEIYIQCDWCRIRVLKEEDLTPVNTRWDSGRYIYNRTMDLCSGCAPEFLRQFRSLNGTR